jgi:asparagine N-glycosylation enzyme membrane subunit Stt3
MLASTILGVFLVPVLYVVVQRIAGDRGPQEPADDAR